MRLTATFLFTLLVLSVTATEYDQNKPLASALFRHVQMPAILIKLQAVGVIPIPSQELVVTR